MEKFCVRRVIWDGVKEGLWFACHHLDPCCGVLVLQSWHITSGSLGMRCFSAETWDPGAVWILTADNIAQVLHLPVRMPAPLGTPVLSTFFTLALGHTEMSMHVYWECYLQHYLPNHVLFPFPLYCGSSLLATGTLYCGPPS